MRASSRAGRPSCRTCVSSGGAPRSSRSRHTASPWRRRSRRHAVAAEWCLPLVRRGGGGRALGRAVGRAGRGSPASPSGSPASSTTSPPGFLVVRKIGPTPAGFPAPPGHGQEAPAGLSASATADPAPGPGASAAAATMNLGAGPGLRDREPEGRRRQDDDRRQPRRLPGRGGRAGAARRPRPAGERHVRPRRRGRTARRRTTCSTGSRSRGSRRPTRFPNLELVPAKPELAGAAVELSLRDGGERYLADALAGATERWSFVFLDCPPSFGPLTVNALAAADRVLVPVQAEYYALEGLSQLLGSIDLVKRRLNPRLGVAGILLTMVDGRTRLSADVEAELRRHFGELVFRPPCPARFVSPRRRATASPRSPTTAARPARRPTGRWRWSLSSVPEAPRRGLGRGLEVLIGGGGDAELLHLPVEAIHPNPRQPRKRFEPEATAGLAASIRQQGVLQPVVVRPRHEGGYELIAGERRWRAARDAGAETVPAVVRDGQTTATRFCSGWSRTSPARTSPPSRRRARTPRSWTSSSFPSATSPSASAAPSRPCPTGLRLLELPEEVLWMLARGELSEGHARAVLALPDDEARLRLARRIARDGMTVRAAERAAQEGGARRRPRAAARRPGAGRAGARRGRAADRPAGPGQRRQGSSSTSATTPASRSSSRPSKRSDSRR